MGKVHTLVGKVHTRKYAKIHAVNKKSKYLKPFLNGIFSNWNFRHRKSEEVEPFLPFYYRPRFRQKGLAAFLISSVDESFCPELHETSALITCPSQEPDSSFTTTASTILPLE